MDRAARIARNLELARKFYDGWRLGGERGRVEGWEADDIAEGAVAFSTWTGEFPMPHKDYGEGATYELNSFLSVLPDLTATDFEAWPTEDGCAWRQKFCGHTGDGTAHEFWESEFIRTTDQGQITRWEFYDDWIGTPKMVKAVTGLALDEMNAENYLTKVIGDSPDLPEFLASMAEPQA